MFVRRTRVEGSPDAVDLTIQNYQQQLIPVIKQEPGFRGAVLLVNRATGAGLSVTMWDSEQTELASRPTAESLRGRGVRNSGSRVLDVTTSEEVLRDGHGAAQTRAGAFVRVNEQLVPPDRLDDGVRFVRDQLVPLLNQQDGFQAVVMDVNREDDRMFITVVWESEVARLASDAAIRHHRQQAGIVMGGAEKSVEEYEIAVIERAEL